MIQMRFNYGTDKVIDFSSFVGKDDLKRTLLEKDFFKKIINLYENGQGIF